MGIEDSAAIELAKLEQAYRQSLADASAMDISDVARIAMILEIEAKFLGAMESCRVALKHRSGKPNGTRRN